MTKNPPSKATIETAIGSFMAVVVVVLVGSVAVLLTGGCSTGKSPGPGWRCWIENAGRAGEIEVCERKTCRELGGGKFTECK